MLLIDGVTRGVRTLNAVATRLTDAAISGRVVVWCPLSPETGGATGVVVDALGSQKRTLHFTVVASLTVTDGRYVLFGWGRAGQVRLYDTQTGANRPLFRTGHRLGDRISSGERTVVYFSDSRSSGPELVVARLP